MYTFKHTLDDSTEIVHNVNVVTAEDLAEAFYYFMLGTGFAKESILESFGYETQAKCCCYRPDGPAGFN